MTKNGNGKVKIIGKNLKSKRGDFVGSQQVSRRFYQLPLGALQNGMVPSIALLSVLHPVDHVVPDFSCAKFKNGLQRQVKFGTVKQF